MFLSSLRENCSSGLSHAFQGWCVQTCGETVSNNIQEAEFRWAMLDVSVVTKLLFSFLGLKMQDVGSAVILNYCVNAFSYVVSLWHLVLCSTAAGTLRFSEASVGLLLSFLDQLLWNKGCCLCLKESDSLNLAPTRGTLKVFPLLPRF